MARPVFGCVDLNSDIGIGRKRVMKRKEHHTWDEVWAARADVSQLSAEACRAHICQEWSAIRIQAMITKIVIRGRMCAAYRLRSDSKLDV